MIRPEIFVEAMSQGARPLAADGPRSIPLSQSMPRPSAASPALAQILGLQAWRDERLLNLIRSIAWTTIGLITGGSEALVSRSVSPGAVLALAWGVGSLAIGLTWLRRFYRYWLSAALSTIDITVLAVCMDAGHRYLLRTHPSLVSHQLYASGIVLFALLAANALRFSWRISLWSVAYGAAAYWVMLWRDGAVDVLTYVELGAFALLGWVLVHSGRKLRVIVRQVVERDSLTRYLPSTVVDRITRDPGALSLEAESQVVTALFSDLCGFTSLAETMAPVEVTRMLNAFFKEMTAEVTSYGGIVMQYTGDNLYAVFPEAGGADHALRAVQAALGMQRRLEALNRARRSEGLPVLSAGIGVHTGPVVAGPIGSPDLLQYTYIGDTVNTASRIEGMTRSVGEHLLVSSVSLEQAGGSRRFDASPIGNVPLRGKRESVEIWAVRGSVPAGGAR